MRKRKVNPCEMKGRYGGKRAGRIYPHSIAVSGCECQKAVASIRPLEFSPQQYALDTEPGENQGGTIPFSPENKKLLCTIPCQEIFRHRISKGTKIYRKLLNEKTKFKGCQPLEEDLVDEGDVLHEMKEIIGLPQATDNVSDPDEEYSVPDSAGALKTPASTARFLLKLAINETTSTRDKPARPPNPNVAEEGLGITANDLKHRHLIRLYDNGAFDDEKDKEKKMERVGAMMIEGISDPKHVSEIVPDISYTEFLRLQGKIYRLVEETLPENVKAFIKFFKEVLTENQREALNLVYMNNDEKESKQDIAAKIGISVDSLNDRLRAGSHKIRTLLPKTDENKKPTEKIKGLWKNPDAQYDGFYYRSEAKKEAPLIEIDPKTGERRERDLKSNPLPPRKKRQGVDVRQIRAWARGY